MGLGFAATVVGCGGVTDSQAPPTQPAVATPHAIVVVSGSAQSAMVGTALPDSLVVRVTDSTGQGLPDITVHWTGAGQLSAGSTGTDQNGRSAAAWRLGTSAGNQAALAQVDGLMDGAAFAARATPGAVTSVIAGPARLILAGGWTQALHFALFDVYGNQITDRSPSWTTSDPAVAAVATGAVGQALAAGTATLTATIDSASASVTAIVVSPGPFAALDAGYYHACGLDQTGKAYCWGENYFGQLGATGPTGCIALGADCSLVPIAVAGGLTFRQIVAGGAHTCALTAAGAAYCWGNDQFGQLGVGGATEKCGTQAAACSHVPLAVSGGLVFASLSAGDSQTCGVTITLQAWCWGYGAQGRLGDGASVNRPQPVQVQAGPPLFDIQTGGSHTCGLDFRGQLSCWGYNNAGQIGDGTLATHLLPIGIGIKGTATAVSVGIAQTCATAAAGDVLYCWGYDGLLGVTAASADCGGFQCVTSPASLPGQAAVVGASLGDAIRCGLSGTAAVCWGTNANGQLGNGGTAPSSSPTPVAGGLAFAIVTVGYWQACGMTVAGQVYCWGLNYHGALGIGDPSPTGSKVPVAVVSPS